MKTLNRLIVIILLLSTALNVGCDENILSDFAKKDTDEALLFEAKKQMDSGSWTSAISLFAEMTPGFRASRSVAFTEASAYAGRCGLDFLTLVENLENSGSTKLLLLLMQAMASSSVGKIADCKQAESLIESIDAVPGNRSIDENLLMAFVGFAKIGSIANTYADTNNDSSADGGFDACSVGDLLDADARHVGTGLVNALNALNAAATAGSTIISSEITNLNSGCSDLGVLAPTYNFCTVTDPATYTADQVKGVRSVFQENEWIGLGTCNDTLDNCLCP